MNGVVYGKQIGFGDFVSHGLPTECFAVLDRWLQTELPKLKEDMGDAWETVWAAAPVLRFWIGPELIGAPLMGAMAASRDKVGRRYPLILGVTGVIAPPPTHPAHTERPHEYTTEHLRQVLALQEPGSGAASLLQRFDPPDVLGEPWDLRQDGTLWGQREDGDLARLFSDATANDADKAQLSRSHWWHEDLPDRAAGWLALNRLPDADALRWLLTARGRAPATAEQRDAAQADIAAVAVNAAASADTAPATAATAATQEQTTDGPDD